MADVPSNALKYTKTVEDVCEITSTRSRENEYVVKRVFYNHPAYVCEGSNIIKKIREESRHIYKIDGKYTLFFDLDKSVSFRKMKRDTKIDLKDYMFNEEDLSLFPDLETLVDETDMRSVEREIDTQTEQFNSVVSSYIDSHNIHNKSEHDPIPHSANILALDEVRNIVHNKSYLICQNRDLCREFLHVACLLVPEKSEIALDVTLSWQQELDTAIF